MSKLRIVSHVADSALVAVKMYSFSGASQVFHFIFPGEAKTKIWDITAVSLIVKEAGGRVTDFNGDLICPESTLIIATNGLIHDEILSIIHGDEDLNGI